ncbi:hypothetical protein ANCCAN_16990 [Ancylostoma caninum]|uniref:Uncharacterized protein n=1 Tax=Ancylostoma caninum TaxID=29170 RepID=A0A368G3E7_ANCCA|nr:hypothetical protein ANCCAN_16990 [Ancylostoma caninum]
MYFFSALDRGCLNFAGILEGLVGGFLRLFCFTAPGKRESLKSREKIWMNNGKSLALPHRRLLLLLATTCVSVIPTVNTTSSSLKECLLERSIRFF